MTTLRLRRFGILLIILSTAPRAVLAQDTGIVTGSVIDASEQVIPGATVTLVNEATSDARTAITNERGEFTFRAVQPGTYTVAAELAGFRKYERRNNVLNASGQLAIGALKLEIGTVSEVVTVTSQGTVVETKNSDYSVLLNTYKAEFGHTAGANIEIVSKSGSNSYHGSGYWYGRRDAWNAIPWENERAGLPKPKLKIDTPGFNLGGPVRIPGLFDQADKKLFFFYSIEAPQVQKPGQIRLYRMPTALERAGDFSQTFDVNGRLTFIKDPLSTGACNVTTGGPGCFPGNVIPKNRLDASGLAVLNYMPLPNVASTGAGSGALSNFTRQETPENPRMNNLLRIDARPSANNSYWASYRQFSSNQLGSEITAGPEKWAFFDGTYVSGDSGINGGWNHISTSNKVNEFGAGIRRATEGFGTKSDSDLTRIQKSTVASTLGQSNPQLNPQNLMPFVRFGLNTTGIDTPDFTYDSRLGSTAYDWLTSFRDNFTWTRNAHTLKVGGHFEYMQNNEARGGNWAGDIQFNNNTSNPLNTNFAFANAILGVFSQYTETDKYRQTQNRQWWSEWYLQDTWQTNSRVTVDYGARFLYYSPYNRPDGQVSNFDPSKYDPKQAPRLYQPALINGARVALDPVTGRSEEHTSELQSPVHIVCR